MEEKDFSFIPVSDMALSDMDIVEQHKQLLKNNNYSEATALLDNNNYSNGMRASLFNEIINRIQTIGLYLLNLTTDPEDYYSLEEPTEDFMKKNGYKFWIKPI